MLNYIERTKELEGDPKFLMNRALPESVTKKNNKFSLFHVLLFVFLSTPQSKVFLRRLI